MRTAALAALGLAAALWLAPAAAAPFKARGFSIEPPAQWQTQAGSMGAALVAKPVQEIDAEGWANDLLIVTSEPYDARRTCLDGFVLRKLKDMGHLANHFEVKAEIPLTLGKAQATLLELRYAEGPRELAAYVVVMASQGQMVTASLASEPQRFEFRRAAFRRAVESLRPAAGKP